MNINELDQAMNCLNIAYKEAQEHRLDRLFTNLLYRNLSSCNRKLRRYSEGIKSAQEGIGAITGEEINSLRRKGDMYQILANLWTDSLEHNPTEVVPYQKAINAYRQALANYEAISNSAEFNKESNRLRVLVNLGELYRRGGDLEAAQKILMEAAAISNSEGISEELLVQMYLNHGDIFLDLQEPERARREFVKGIRSVDPNWGEYAAYPVESNYFDRSYLFNLIAKLAKAYTLLAEKEHRKNNLTEATKAYEASLKIVDLIRGDFISDKEKLRLAAEIQPNLAESVGVCWHLYQAGEKKYKEMAFRFIDRSKAFRLLEVARANNGREMLSEKLKTEEDQLRKERLTLQDELILSGGAINTSLEKRQAQNFHKQQEWFKKVKDQHPEYYQLKYEGGSMGIKEVQRTLLEKEQALLEYFYTDSVLYTFVILADTSIFVQEEMAPNKLDELVENYNSSLNQLGEVYDSLKYRQMGEYSHQLFELLIGPVEPHLPERVIVIPHGKLNNLSFATLLRRNPGEEGINNTDYLIHKYAFSYNFSANMLAEMKKGKTMRRKKMAVFAPNYADKLEVDYQAANLQKLMKARDKVTKLDPYNLKAEIEGIRSVDAKTRPFEEANAHKAAFLQAAQKYSSIHIAGHGILDPNDPELSFIAFAQMGPYFNPDNLLYVKDIYAYRFSVEMIFLSACQSASGDFATGEGNISLAQAFAYAGVKSIVSSLWDLSTYAKSEISPAFYGYYNDGLTADVALAKAQRDFMDYGNENPKDWGAIIVIGEAQKRP